MRHFSRYKLNHREDGFEHINAYTKSPTVLGRALSNLADIGFNYYDEGHFASLESFWYWAKTGKKHEFLKSLPPFKAKEEGRKLEVVPYKDFMNDVEVATYLKIVQNKWLCDMFTESTLPITHYMTVGSDANKICVPVQTTAWFEYFYPILRERIKTGEAHKGLRIIVAGSREITDYKLICDSIFNSQLSISQIVSGGAKGVDKLGELFANDRNIPLKIIKADWDNDGKIAGFIRNQEMAEYSDALVAVWDGKSSGTKHCIDTMKKMKKLVYLVNLGK